MKRLLADIEARRVDVVVVYKIDRLSRSLMDFAKLVDVFDRNNVTFVSVTQSFNTTTSMGKLTLNILLSFAQFEREVIGERIRDKEGRMTSPVSWARDGRALTVRVPLAIRKRGGRKLVITPDGRAWSRPSARVDSTLIKALVRAHRWKRLLETGEHATVTELARSEKINMSYLSRMLRLTLLAPDIVEAVLDGRQSATLQLERIWRGVLGGGEGAAGRFLGGR